MRVTLLGHASVLVEMQGVRCLMDPVFADPFEEGAVVSCPRRAVHVDKLPPIDVIILSHSHLDHFDIPSLARLPRDCQVLCPKDQVLTYTLGALGFSKVQASDPMTHMAFADYELITTHSNVSNVVEFGVVFKDRSGTFWNQVDTVLAPQTIQTIKKKYPRIDLLFAMHASQNFGFFDGKQAGFPHKMHEMNLNTAVAIAPRMAVPGAAGFRFCGPIEWANAFLFPMSRERFVADLQRIAPAIETRIANPGDVFEIEQGTVRHLPGASEVATTLEDDTALLRYDPTAEVPPLTDPNPDGYPAERMWRAMKDCLAGLSEFINGAYKASDPIVAEYRRLRASYAVGIVFPDGQEHFWQVRFDEARPHFESGPGVASADVVHRMAASALLSWMAREKSYFYLRAFSRKFTTLYGLSQAGGNVSVEPQQVEDLLMYFLSRKMKGADLAVKQRLDLQLRPYLNRP